jgi:hypothetical protein
LGSIARAVPYLFAPADSQQRVRERVELVHGDAQQLIDIVNTLPVSPGAGPGSAYDSIVLSFAPRDEPSHLQIQQIVDVLPNLLFPGGTDRVCWLAKLHSHGSNVHLHILCAQVDLKTGLQFSLSGLGLRPFKEFCRVLNRHHGWADSEDEFRGRLAWWSKDITGSSVPAGTGIQARARAQAQAQAQAKARALAIAAVLEDRVACQADMVRVLRPLGTLVRTGRCSITLEVTGGALAESSAATVVRLKGLLYARNFNRKRILHALAPAPLPAALTRRDTPLEDKRLAEELWTHLQHANKVRAKALAERYAVKPNRARRSLVTRMAWELARDAPQLEIDLYQRLPTALNTTSHPDLITASASASASASVLVPIAVRLPTYPHETTSHTDHRIFAAGDRRVSARADSIAGRAVLAAKLPGLDRALHRSLSTWIEDSLVPSVLQMARRAIGTALDNVRGAYDPAVRPGRRRSAP